MIGFVGLSHLGMVLSAATAARGFLTIAYDPDPELGQAIRRRELPIVEPGLPELYDQAERSLTVVSDPAPLGRCDLIFVSRDMPMGSDGRADLTVVDDLVALAAAHARAGAALVVLSQVPPGYTRRLAGVLRAKHGERALSLYCQVETLVFGSAVERAMRPHRFIVGCEAGGMALPAAYARLLGSWGCPILTMSYESAEMAKVAVNVLLAAAVTATNTLAELCEAIGADWAEIVPALRLDPRVGPDAYVEPGPGIGGGNLERDLLVVDALAREHGTDVGLIGACLANSRYRREWALRHLHGEVLSRQRDAVVAVWGLAYKASTDSTTNSPAVTLIEAIGPGRVRIYDPHARPPGQLAQIARVGSPLDACSGAAALVVMTPWREFAAVSLVRVRDAMAGRTIVDPFGILDGGVARRLGFSYFRLGAPVPGREVTA